MAWLGKSDNGLSRLSDAVTSTATTITVDDASSFPDGTEDFTITVWNDLAAHGYTQPAADPHMEHMLVTAVSGNVFTVTRGYAGTSAAAHIKRCRVGNYALTVWWEQLQDAIDANTVQTLTVVAKTSTYTLSATDVVCLCTGTFTITLPTAVGATGKTYYVKNVGSGTITLDGDGAETIDGETTQPLQENDTAQVCSDGANWVIL